MAVSLAIDPVTRIEGHLKARLEVDGNMVRDAWLTGGMFRGFENFYIIDTGIYPLEEIEAYIQPLADMIDGRISKVRGDWGILKKMAAGKIDDDFLVAKKGETVKEILQRERHTKSF